MKTKKWLNKNCSQLKNKLIIVSGTTGGIGGEVLKNLVSLGAQVICAVRNLERAEAQKQKILNEFPNAKIFVEKLDLSSIQSIKQFAEDIKKNYPNGIYAIVNNAGIYAQKKQEIYSGIEKHFFTNCIAPIMLYKLLKQNYPNKKFKTVFVDSISYRFTKINLNDMCFNKYKGKTKTYANSKRWLLAYMHKLKSTLPDDDAQNIVICHPGVCASSLMSPKNSGMNKFVYGFINTGMKIVFQSTAKASLNEVYALAQTTKNGQWIGPGVIGLYGKPKIKKYRLKESPQTINIVYQKIEDICNNFLKQ